MELRLIQMDASSRSSVGQTGGAIAAIAPDTVKLIQDYFETNPPVYAITSEENCPKVMSIHYTAVQAQGKTPEP